MDNHTSTGSSDAAPTISPIGKQYLRFHLVPEVGPIRLARLLEHFGSPDSVFAASRSELQRVEGIGPKIADSIVEYRNSPAVDREVEQATTNGVRILCPLDTEYPVPLKHIADPPICLYVRGSLEPADAVAIAIVGTRRCSYYGREQALRFAELLAKAGFTIISGLARGVDSHAHRGALNAQGRTIAVLGNGLPAIYPPEHESLAADIRQNGAVLTESPMDSVPSTESFPRRNRIIAGLALGTLIIEAGKQSGALITARLATEYNREVFALPGRVDQPELTAGVNRLIRDGHAKLVTSLDDILDELGKVGEAMRKEADQAVLPAHLVSSENKADSSSKRLQRQVRTSEMTAVERRIVDLLGRDVFNTDQLAQETGLGINEVIPALTALELKGWVTRLPGSRYACRRRPE